MYKITLKIKSTEEIFLIDNREEITRLQNMGLNGFFGKSEREIVEFSESYEVGDVLSSRSESVGEGVVNYVTLKAEYVITEEDLSQNADWLLQECYRLRQTEYPTVTEIAEATMEKFGEARTEKFDALQLRRLATKAKFPKPGV